MMMERGEKLSIKTPGDTKDGSGSAPGSVQLSAPSSVGGLDARAQEAEGPARSGARPPLPAVISPPALVPASGQSKDGGAALDVEIREAPLPAEGASAPAAADRSRSLDTSEMTQFDQIGVSSSSSERLRGNSNKRSLSGFSDGLGAFKRTKPGDDKKN